jgi:thiamine pyrophosphate-dependent acetolactate synthase large subunit-like protein
MRRWARAEPCKGVRRCTPSTMVRGPSSARSMLGLDHPFLNWVKIGEGFGVPGVAVDRAEDLARELEKALTHKGPRLIEAIMS